MTRSSGSFFESFDLVENVLRRLLAHAFEREQLVEREGVDVGDGFHQPTIDELVDERVAHALDVHHAARGEVQDALAQLRRAVGVDAAVVGFAFDADDVASAFGAAFGHVKLAVSARVVLVVDNLHDLRNNVAAALDQDVVADLDAEIVDEVHVVQRGAGDGGAADEHRL